MGAKDQPQEPKRESILNPNPNPNPNPTPNQNSISETQFLSWKRQKDAVASASKAEASRKRAEDIAAGTVQMNGRELFLHEPWVFDNTLY